MEYTNLGRTGLRVSRLCLGTMNFGSQCDQRASNAILDRAAAGGITFIDTADVYPAVSTGGRTEEILGRWMKGRRDEVIDRPTLSSLDDGCGARRGRTARPPARAPP